MPHIEMRERLALEHVQRENDPVKLATLCIDPAFPLIAKQAIAKKFLEAWGKDDTLTIITLAVAEQYAEESVRTQIQTILKP